VDHFISHFNKIQNKNIKGVSPEALSLLMAYDWPGNIRELENVIERASILCPGDEIKIEHLPDEIISSSPPKNSDMRTARTLLEKEIILTALQQNKFDPIKTAKSLGIHKTTLYRKLKKLNIPLPKNFKSK
jgi:DNA-binding NtrC family response regulator